MGMKDSKISFFIRIFTFALITFSIAVTYHTMVVRQDYEILTNPEGPDTSDYFEE